MRQLDQALVQFFLQPGYLWLQGQDSLAKHMKTHRDVQTSTMKQAVWRLRLVSDLYHVIFFIVCFNTFLSLLTYWPVAGARVQRAASLLRIHGDAQCWFRHLVTELGREAAFKLCSVRGGKELIVSLLTRSNKSRSSSFRQICSPCSLTEGSLVVLSTQCSTAAPQGCVCTEGWGLAHRWRTGWMAVCTLEQEPSLAELLKPSFWDCTL